MSPPCSSDIVTDSPFSRVTLDVDGKHPPAGGGAGGGGHLSTVGIAVPIRAGSTRAAARSTD